MPSSPPPSREIPLPPLTKTIEKRRPSTALATTASQSALPPDAMVGRLQSQPGLHQTRPSTVAVVLPGKRVRVPPNISQARKPLKYSRNPEVSLWCHCVSTFLVNDIISLHNTHTLYTSHFQYARPSRVFCCECTSLLVVHCVAFALTHASTDSCVCGHFGGLTSSTTNTCCRSCVLCDSQYRLALYSSLLVTISPLAPLSRCRSLAHSLTDALLLFPNHYSLCSKRTRMTSMPLCPLLAAGIHGKCCSRL